MSNEIINENLEAGAAENNSGLAPRLPKQVYKFRVTEEPEFKVSKAGNDMLIFKAEVISPATAVVDGVEATVAGLDVTLYAVFSGESDGPKKNQTLAALHRAGGLPLQFQRSKDTGLPLDETGSPYRYTGIEFDALANSQEYAETDESGNPIVDPRTGQPLVSWSRRVSRIFA